VGAYLVAQGFFKLSCMRKRALMLASLIVISVSAKDDVYNSIEAVLEASRYHHPQAKPLATFQRYLATRAEGERDFLNPSGMYFHWQLNEPRHGFPHAANTAHIVSHNWWRSAEIPEAFQLPKNRDTYCEMLETNGPTLVVELDQSDVTECFSHKADSTYVRVNPGTVSAATELWIFERLR
ncbi:MAG: hypothetical protein ACI8PT_003008, partial [Gammaproteobacteria bacterium]